jgi:hypothetical protein
LKYLDGICCKRRTIRSTLIVQTTGRQGDYWLDYKKEPPAKKNKGSSGSGRIDNSNEGDDAGYDFQWENRIHDA